MLLQKPWLMTDAAKNFRMEAAASVAKEPGQTRDWYALFGSIGAFMSADRYRNMEWN